MDWTDEVRARLKRGNQVLFGKDSAYLQDLALLLREQEHRAVVLWALEFAAESVEVLEERYPEERRPRQALEAARAWAAGEVRMRLAQRAILDCHGLAKELDRREDIALCHAVGQACAVVHTAGHGLGYPIYDLTSIVYRLGIDQCAAAVEARKQAYVDRLLHWSAHWTEYPGRWAGFLLK